MPIASLPAELIALTESVQSAVELVVVKGTRGIPLAEGAGRSVVGIIDPDRRVRQYDHENGEQEDEEDHHEPTAYPADGTHARAVHRPAPVWTRMGPVWSGMDLCECVRRYVLLKLHRSRLHAAIGSP